MVSISQNANKKPSGRVSPPGIEIRAAAMAT